MKCLTFAHPQPSLVCQEGTQRESQKSLDEHPQGAQAGHISPGVSVHTHGSDPRLEMWKEGEH